MKLYREVKASEATHVAHAYKDNKTFGIAPIDITEERLAEIFANHADHTPYLNFDAFKEAINEMAG